MKKLNPEDLFVTSFVASPSEAISAAPGTGLVFKPDTSIVGTIILSPADPTAATHCYICPVRTGDCY